MKKSLITLLLLFCLNAFAQNGVTNNGGLQIHTNGSMTVFGDFTNAATATLTNNGNFYTKGSVTNNQASMIAGTGSLILNGNSTQTISGSQPLKTFNITTDNTAGFTVNNNLHVTGSHTFSNGVITTSASNFIVYESGASYSDASDAAHVNGWIKKIGNTGFIFPTGNASFLREVEITNLSASSEFNAQYNGAMPASYRVVQSPLYSIYSSEYWTINQVAGGSVQIKLNWNNAKVAFPNYPVSDLRAARRSGSGFWTSIGGTGTGNSATTGSVTSDPVSNFGSFAIGGTSTIVPLKFLGISAVRENASAKVTWQTANEVAVNFHEVQKSTDGTNFISIGKLAAKNSSYQSYTFIDWNAGPTKLFYRIKEIDLDGSVRYSKVATVVATGQSEYLELIQNPVHSAIQLTAHAGTSSVYFYQLVNNGGQVCKKGSFESNGISQISIPVNVQPGEYTLIVSNSKSRQQFKLIIL
jgi:hypothetical protein